jgi:chaperonin GroES
MSESHEERERARIEWQPLADRLLVEPLPEPTRTRTGLHLAPGERETPQRGRVLAVGQGVWEPGPGGGWFQPTYLEVGDEVLFGRYAGTRVEIEGRDLVILRATDVLARRARPDRRPAEILEELAETAREAADPLADGGGPPAAQDGSAAPGEHRRQPEEGP